MHCSSIRSLSNSLVLLTERPNDKHNGSIFERVWIDTGFDGCHGHNTSCSHLPVKNTRGVEDPVKRVLVVSCGEKECKGRELCQACSQKKAKTLTNSKNKLKNKLPSTSNIGTPRANVGVFPADSCGRVSTSTKGTRTKACHAPASCSCIQIAFGKTIGSPSGETARPSMS